MVRSETPEPAGDDQSLGDLIALAAKDVTQLIRYEIDLATTELKGDARRVGMAVGAIALAAFVVCLVLVLLSLALAYGLNARGIVPLWASFLIVSGLYILLAGIALAIALLRVRRMSGLSKTRKSVTEGLGVLGLNGKQPDNQRPEITAPKTP